MGKFLLPITSISNTYMGFLSPTYRSETTYNEATYMAENRDFLVHMLAGPLQYPDGTFRGLDPIVESQRKVLLHIALSGIPQTKYEIEKITGVNHASVHEAVKKLKEIGALEGKEIGKTRTGQPKTEYTLTLYGVCLAILHADRKNQEAYGKIAEKWVRLEPVTLGKWKYFNQKKDLGKEVANAFLVNGAFAYVGEKELLDSGELSLDDFRVCAIELLIENARCYIEAFHNSKDDPEAWKEYVHWYRDVNPETTLEMWITAIKEDPELKKYLVAYVDDVFRRAKNEVEWGQFLKLRIETKNR
jgi:hypothetical protein